MNNYSPILLLIVLGLTACAEQATKSVVLVPVEERNSPNIDHRSATTPEPPDTAKSKHTNNKPQESVIVALLDDADNLANAGKSEQAAAMIERALRIEPRNALLWHRLALIRIQQQQWQQAITMARKSNALATNNDKLKSENWGVIALAYDKLGIKQKANEARMKQKTQG
jgi:tetratricopeptide (TPR) repeat protein